MFTEGNAFHKLHVFVLWRSLTIIVHISAALAFIRHNYPYSHMKASRGSQDSTDVCQQGVRIGDLARM